MLVSLDFFRTIIDRIVDDLKTTKDKLQLLQPKITGQSGQVVGFDSDGNVVATDKPSYTAQEVGALPATTAIPSTATDVNAEPIGAVSQHNASDAAHSDIRLLIRGLSERLSAVADSDDTTLDQLSEIVAYIKSNKSLIDAITTSKVGVADIVDDLTTNVANKPLSAAQGVALKALIDALTEAMPGAYTLPIASSTSLGGVQPADKTDAMTQAVGVDADGGLWAAIAYPVVETTDAAKELSPNTYYKWGEMSILTITLGSEIAGIVNEFCGEFVSGETATTFSVPESVSWPNGLTVDANRTYQFSIVNGIGVIIGA